MRLPADVDRVFYPQGREIAVYMKNFALGLRFPIHPDILQILCFIGMPIAQMPPNSLGLIISFVALCRLANIDLSINLFWYFFNRHEHPEGCYVGVDARYNRKLLKTNTSNKDWKDGFVFIVGPEEFPFPNKLSVMNSTVSRSPRLFEEEQDRDFLLQIDPAQRTVDFLTKEETLIQASLWGVTSHGKDRKLLRSIASACLLILSSLAGMTGDNRKVTTAATEQRVQRKEKLTENSRKQKLKLAAEQASTPAAVGSSRTARGPGKGKGIMSDSNLPRDAVVQKAVTAADPHGPKKKLRKNPVRASSASENMHVEIEDSPPP